MAVVGIDGCRAGWFAVRLEDSGEAQSRVFGEFDALWREWGDASLILVDIPIGLPDKNVTQRSCDSVARRLIGPRRSSVFPPPSRAALEHPTYRQASDANFHEVGRKLAWQTFYLIPKVRDVDRLLNEIPASRERVREVHPEVCFWAFAGERPMSSNKKRAAGREERLAVLRGVDRRSDTIVESAKNSFLRGEVAVDDVLDALVAAYTAGGDSSKLRSIPAVPETDSCGLPMEMVYSAQAISHP